VGVFRQRTLCTEVGARTRTRSTEHGGCATTERVTITWACPISLSDYEALGPQVPAPRLKCAACSRPLIFAGSYRREVREAGVVHRIVVRRALCPSCGTSDALLPDFVLKRRKDSTSAVGAAVLERAGMDVPAGSNELYRGVPSRTVGSWLARFAERADELRVRFAALTVEWGGELPFTTPHVSTSQGRALDAIGLAWRAARRRGRDVPAAWLLANVVVGSQLLATRVDLPWPIVPRLMGRSRSP